MCTCCIPYGRALRKALVSHHVGFSRGVGCFFQAEDGIRDLVRSRGLGDVYKRQALAARALLRRQ